MKENLSESNLRDPVETLCGVFKDMQVPDKPGDRVRWMGALLWSFYEIFIKTQHQEPCQDITFSPWRTWMYMMDLEMGSGEWRALWNYSEIFIKIRCQMIGIILQKVLRKFYQDLTSGTLSRLHLSSKSLPGVLEVPDKPGVGVRCYGLTFRSFCESFIKIQYQKPCQDSTCPPSLFLESWRTWWFLMNLEVV